MSMFKKLSPGRDPQLEGKGALGGSVPAAVTLLKGLRGGEWGKCKADIVRELGFT